MAEIGPVFFYARRLACNVYAGAKLAFFLPLREHEFRASPVDYAVLVLASFVLWILAAAVRADFSGEFDLDAVVIALATVALVLGTALLLAQAYRAPERVSLFAVALSAADPLFELISMGVPAAGDALGAPWLVAVLFVAWGWLASVRVVLICGGRQRPQVYQGVLAVTAMMAISLYVLPQTEVWVAPDADDELQETLGGGLLRMRAEPLKDLPH